MVDSYDIGIVERMVEAVVEVSTSVVRSASGPGRRFWNDRMTV